MGGRHAVADRFGWEQLRLPLGCLVVATLSIAVRLPRSGRVYDIFIDETSYGDIARSVAGGNGVTLHGDPFILHPPLGFLIMGAAARARTDLEPAALILALRPLCLTFGALVVTLVFAACWLAGMRRAAMVAAALLVIDPFALFFEGRLMLEAIAQTFTAATVLACVMASRGSHRTSMSWPIAAGVLGAATFATKETFGLVVCAMLAVLALFPAAMPRRSATVALGGTLTGYGLVNLYVISRVGWGAWWSARFDGLLRLIGVKQTTGFKAPGTSVSLTSRLSENLGQYAVTYCLLVAGGLVALLTTWLTVRGVRRVRRRARRAADPTFVFVAWSFAACAYVAYAVGFGSLEEQMFYIPLAPCAVLTGLLLVLLRRSARIPAVAPPLFMFMVLFTQGAVYADTRSFANDGYAQFLAWLPQNVAGGGTISVTEETAQFLIRGHRLGQWNDVESLRSNRVGYVLLSEHLADQGYGIASRDFVGQVKRHGQLVFQFTGRGGHDLMLYDVRRWTGGAP